MNAGPDVLDKPESIITDELPLHTKEFTGRAVRAQGHVPQSPAPEILELA